jgi:hypothetical protein
MARTEISTFPIHDLLEVLQWSGPGTIEAELWAVHEARLVERFEVVRRSDRYGILGALYDGLPPASRTRFLTAPETAFRLFFAPNDTRFLIAALCAEARLVGDRSSPGGTWTASGDWYLPRGAAGPTAMDAVDDCFAWSADQPFRAPTLDNGAPIDLHSPYARRLNKCTRVTEFVPFEADAGRQATAVAREAMAGVGAVTAARRMTATFVRTLVLERHLDHARAFTSYSLQTLVGRTAMQFSVEKYDVTAMANALVHEAIHTVLYIVGHTLPYLRGDVDDAYTIRSPWSGRALDPYSFAHAIFVWFGLWQFWQRARGGETIFPREKIAERLDKAHRGFEGPELERALDEHAAVLAPHVVDGVRVMLGEIRRGAFD